MPDSASNFGVYATFYLGDQWYGISVDEVQEVGRSLPLTPIPLAPKFIKGLANLRGQIATTVSLRELFGRREAEDGGGMNVICTWEGTVLSLMVDRIGDVVDGSRFSFEPAPETIPAKTRRFLKGIFKGKRALMSVLDVNAVAAALEKAPQKFKQRSKQYG